MISLQTNVDSLNAQNNLNIDEQFQSKTINSLTSGYRINSSGDDAAGLAVANGLRGDITELTQGVQNATTGVAQLQIVDGGLSNISTILDRMKTLATESASGTFTGDRNTLNQEYTGLISEITRQATNINLNAGGSFNQALSVYIGGASTTANAAVNVDLSGTANAVDATSLGLANTSIAGGGSELSGNALNLTAAAAGAGGGQFLKGTGTQIFNFYTAGSTAASAITLNATTNGSSLTSVLSQLNSALANNTNTSGISASVDANGKLQFTSSSAFTVDDQGPSANTVTNTLTDYTAAKAAPGYVANSAGAGSNGNNYSIAGAATYANLTAGTTTLTFTTASGANVGVSLDSTNASTLATAVALINTATSAYGINATLNSAGTGISFQSSSSFSVNDSQTTGAAGLGVFTSTDTATGGVSYAAAAPPASDAGTAAISALNTAIQSLGLVQGSVGAGENKLQYAMNLANSQISNYSTMESGIRDADVAAEAANLTKSQVLQQASISAMAQANSEPQAVLKLLQG